MKRISALKLLDEAILPFVLVGSAKLISALIFCLILNIEWQFGISGGRSNLFFISLGDRSDFFLINSLSDIFMVLTCAIGTTWVLFRESYFNESNLHPIFLAKLHKTGNEAMIVNSFEAYHQITVWLTLSLLTTLFVFYNAILSSTSLLVLGLSLVSTIGLGIIFWEKLRKFKH